MDEKFLALIATFDDETSQEMKEIERILHEAGLVGTQTPGIPHHITLTYYDHERVDEVKELAESVSSSTKRFDISFNHIGLFSLKVLFLGPDVNHELLNLYERLRVNDVEPEWGWTPHATLLIDDAENIHKALDLVVQQIRQINGRIESLQLYESDPFKLIGEYTLVEK